MALAVVIAVVVATCLYQLEQRHADHIMVWTAAPMLGVAALTLRAIQLRLAPSRGTCGGDPRLALALVLVAGVLLLSTIGTLVRISLGRHGLSILSEPLIGGLGLLLLFAAAEVARLARPSWRLAQAFAAVALLFAVWQAVERGRLATVPPGDPSLLDWPTALLAFVLLGLVTLALTRRPPGMDRWLAWLLPGQQPHSRWAAVPVVAALALLAYTASLCAAVALFAGGMGALASTAAVATPAGGAVARGERRSGGLARSSRTGLACLAGFGVGACLIVLAGELFDLRGFGHVTLLASPRSDPDMVLPHYPYVFGVGWQLRALGIRHQLGAGQVILSTIGRETGLAGIAGLIVLFAGLLGTLLLLGRRQPRDSFGRAWTTGLAAFLGLQFLIAMLRLLGMPSLYSAGPPLLAGGIAWYVATVVAIGVAIGCAARPAARSGVRDGREAEARPGRQA